MSNENDKAVIQLEQLELLKKFRELLLTVQENHQCITLSLTKGLLRTVGNEWASPFFIERKESIAFSVEVLIDYLQGNGLDAPYPSEQNAKEFIEDWENNPVHQLFTCDLAEHLLTIGLIGMAGQPYNSVENAHFAKNLLTLQLFLNSIHETSNEIDAHFIASYKTPALKIKEVVNE